jgi:hypothetical protein
MFQQITNNLTQPVLPNLWFQPPQGQRVFVAKIFVTKAYFFRHKPAFVATFKIATSRHRYLPHKYSSDDFSFPTNNHAH